MELLIFFLKTWSILWTFVILGWTWALFTKIANINEKVSVNIQFNLKTCFELALYITSIYAWFL